MKLPLSLSHTPAGRRLLVALALFGLCLTRSISQSQAAGPPPMIDAWPIEASAVDDFSSGIDICTPPIAPVTLSNPTIVTNCTQAGLQTALNQGGQIAFDCGPNPVTINISSPLATSATKDTVIDGSTGAHFESQSVDSLLSAIDRCPKHSALACRENAERFSEERFREQIARVVREFIRRA